MNGRLAVGLIATFTALAPFASAAQSVDPHAAHAALVAASADASKMHDMTSMPGMDHSSQGGVTNLLTSSSPADGATAQGSPSEVVMTFTRAVALESVVLTNEVGQQIPRRSTLPVDPVEAVRFPVPISLRPGSYTVAWRAADMDHAHGSFSFRVAAPGGRIPQPMPMSHHH